MNDDFEGAVRAAGKSGAVQAFAMIETVVKIFLSYGASEEGAENLNERTGTFSEGWQACAGALSELAITMREHASISAVVSGEGEGELVHMRPEQMHKDIVRVLHKYLFGPG